MHNVCYTCSVALCFVLDPTLSNLESPTYKCTWCMFSLAGCEGRTHQCALLGSLKVKEYINLWDSCLLHIGNSSHKIICIYNQIITFQIIV